MSRTRQVHTFPILLCFFLLAPPYAFAQEQLSGAAQIRLALAELAAPRSVLMIAAHPDDEKNNVLAYCARGLHARTAYLSLTRGEGGQNLIGPEQGALLGVIRSQELQQARRVDGAEQYFTRAIDFGFSKSAQESIAKWGHDEVLSDIVWVIRRFQPDVVILRWSGTPADGHGHHQASAILAREAIGAAADPLRFPEQLKYARAWTTMRVLQFADSRKTPGAFEIDTGAYDPALGFSYGEIAGMSRSKHRSQGMGSAQQRGPLPADFVSLDGKPAGPDLFAGIAPPAQNATALKIIGGALHTFDPEHPERTVAALLKYRALTQDANSKRKVDEAIALCAGLWLDATSQQKAVVRGGDVLISATAVNRSPLAIKQVSASLESGGSQMGAANAHQILSPNHPLVTKLNWTVPQTAAYSQPYWLQEPVSGDRYTVRDLTLVGLPESSPFLQVRFRIQIDDQTIEYVRPVINRYVDKVYGELTRPFVVEPRVAVQLPEEANIFPSSDPRNLEVQVQATEAEESGTIRLKLPPGWKADPIGREFRLAPGEDAALRFHVTPPAQASTGEIGVVVKTAGENVDAGVHVISYPHFPEQTVFPRASAKLVRTDIKSLARNIGYIMGAGDLVPEALRQMGCSVTLLDPDRLTRGSLNEFDAIVTGVRAYNVRPDLRANEQRLLDYVQQGGTLIVQYNVVEDKLGRLGPYPMVIGKARIVDENAPVEFPDPTNALLHFPNEITRQDFAGWVQERGLYFATSWDPRYQPLFASHDAGEKVLEGGTLAARYGKGAYVFTAYSWFRQLPAGVPGAFRVFANLLSAGQTLK